MCEDVVKKKFDKKLEPLDWRYSAAIVGLYKYMFYIGDEGIDFNITDDTFEFCESDITEEKYLEFVEYYYDEKLLSHKKLENLLRRETISEEQNQEINDILKNGNTIIKKVFEKRRFDGTNKKELLNIIEKNRSALIKETYRNKKNMYANFANTNQLLNEGKERCRLLGYYVDPGRKSKAISYHFDTNSFVGKDDKIFDFIPFGFLGDKEAFFINDSFSVRNLIHTNINFEHFVKTASEEKKDTRKILFKSMQETADFLDYDVEVILKKQENEFFETMYIRKESIDILRKIKLYDPFCRSYKVSDNYYLNIQTEVLSCILNLVRTDYLIELYLKQKSEYLVSQFITINRLICGGGEEMKQLMKGAYACAKEVAKKLPENKIDSYRQKLISSIVFKDYDRCCQILLQLSNYADVTFDFAYDLFENFEENKDIAYTFINALTTGKKEEK